jgi:poly(A) polymerase
MTDAVPRQSWMTKPSLLAVLDALEAAAGEGAARFVGGCVRDAVLNRPVGDVDIATSLEPHAVVQALNRAGLGAVPTGIDHGTVTAQAQGDLYEITTLRRDVETDGRRAVVAFTSDWEADAARRDFRLNALYLDRRGVLYDPTGEGLTDARAGRIVFVGDPATRIQEDYLRILRFFRFYAWFGRGDADASALKACAALKDGLRSLSGERIAKEILKLLAADDPRPTLSLMAASGVLSAVLPEAAGLKRVNGLIALETELLFTCDPLLRLAALLPDETEAVERAARRLRLSGAEARRLAAAVSGAVRIVSWLSPREIRRAIYRLGASAFQDQVKLAWAASDRPASFPQWRLLLVYPETWTPPPFPIGGAEIMAAGVPKGPLVGQVRQEVEAFWLDLDFTDDVMALLERLKAVAQGVAY